MQMIRNNQFFKLGTYEQCKNAKFTRFIWGDSVIRTFSLKTPVGGAVKLLRQNMLSLSML